MKEIVLIAIHELRDDRNQICGASVTLRQGEGEDNVVTMTYPSITMAMAAVAINLEPVFTEARAMYDKHLRRLRELMPPDILAEAEKILRSAQEGDDGE